MLNSYCLVGEISVYRSVPKPFGIIFCETHCNGLYVELLWPGGFFKKHSGIIFCETHWIVRLTLIACWGFFKILSYRSSPYFSACEQFCRDWDMTSFDPEYPNMQLDEYDDDICWWWWWWWYAMMTMVIYDDDDDDHFRPRIPKHSAR